MATLVSVVLASLPLLILPGILFYYDVTPKIAILLLASGAALLFFRENGRAMRALFATREGRWFALLLGVQQVSLIAATVFSDNAALSLGGSNWRRYGLLTQSALLVFALLMAGHFAVSPGLLVRALRATALAGCIAAVYGIAQYFGWDPLLPAASYHVGEGEFMIVRPPGPLGHAAYFSTYLLYALFAGIGLWGKDRWLSWCAVLVIPVAILMSGTRAALLGLAAGVLVLAVMKRPSWRAVSIVAAAALACVSVLLLTPAGDRLRARVHWSMEDVRGGARLLLWRDSLRMSAAHWAAGTGLETFGSSFPVWQSKELSRQYPDFYHESPHNLFLDALTSQGVIGLMVWLGLCGLTLALGRRNPVVAAGFAAGLVSLQFSSLTVPTALSFLLFAAAMAGSREARAEPASGRWLMMPILFGGVLLAAGVKYIVADQRLQATKSALDAGRTDEAASLYQQARRWAVPGGSADIFYSRRMAAAGRWPEALGAGRRATLIAEDRQNAYYNLATLQAALNDAAGVEASLKGAISVSPNWFKPHWTLAQVYEVQGRLEEAEKEAAIAVDLAGGRFAEVTETLTRIRRAKGRR